MSLTIFYASALVWAFPCAISAIVAGAVLNGAMRPWKRALVGVGVGAVFGIAIVFLVSFVSAVSFFLAVLLPARFAPVFTSIILTIIAATIAGTAVGALAPRSARAVRRCALVGFVFGLVIGIANAAVAPVVRFAVSPDTGWTSIGDFSAEGFGVLVMVVGIIVDMALAIAALLWLRRLRDGRSPASGV